MRQFAARITIYCQVGSVKGNYAEVDVLQFSNKKLQHGKPHLVMPESCRRLVMRIRYDSPPAWSVGDQIRVDGFMTYSLRRGSHFVPTIRLEWWQRVDQNTFNSHLLAAKLDKKVM